MKYDDLDDKAKERARDKAREWVCQDNWWEYVYEDAIRVGKLLGIEIGTHSSTSYSTRRGENITYTKPDIWFQLSYSQGDGCCFGGRIYPKQMLGAVARIAEYAPQDDTLKELATRAEDIYTRWLAMWTAQRLLDTEASQQDLDESLAVSYNDRCFSTYIDSMDFEDPERSFEDEFNSLVSDFAGWIYDQLQAESDYQHSDEAVEEMIKANDYDFDEDGEV